MDQSGSQSIESVLPVFRRCRKCTNVFDCLDRLRPMSRFLHQSIEGFIKTCLFEIDLHPRFESVIFLQRREATFWDSMNGIFVQSFVHSSRMSCCCKPKYKQPRENKPLLTDYLHSRVQVVKPTTEQQIRASSLIAVKLLLRATQLEFKRPLVDIGCRQLKYFYDVYNWTSGQTGDGVLALTRMSKKSRINIQTRKFISTVLKGINHPNIDRPVEIEVLPDSSALCVTRKVYRRGSLRDHLYHSLYHAPFVTKYYKTSPSPFKEDDIASIGRQILEALSFLESQGIPYTHLSAGNVMLTSGGIARLSETENAFLKVERFYEHVFREFAEQRQAAFLLADINVLAFGCVLYEMSTAMPIHRLVDLDNTALGLPELTGIINKIFHADGKNTLVPTVSELLAEPFFAQVKLPKAARTKPEDLQAANFHSWSVTEKDILKDALKANSKLIYPDDEKSYMATLTNNTALTSPSHNQSSQLGGFAIVPKPAKVKKARTVTPAPRTSSSGSSTPKNSLTAPPPPRAPTGASPSPPPPPPPAGRSASPAPASAPNKNALLNSISGFNASGLKKTVTNDRSAPKF